MQGHNGARMLVMLALPGLLGGCLARAAIDAATLPVKAVGKTVDVLTTSQDEADRNRGRAIRKEEEEIARERRRAERERAREEAEAAREDARRTPPRDD
jgi:hypothetical protein